MGIGWKIGISVLAALCSAFFYRAGGMGKEVDARPTWMPMALRRSWCRDWICPAFSLVVLLIWWHQAVWYKLLLASIISYGLMGGAFSTYLDSIFGYDNYYAHGFLVGLAVLPFFFVGLAWWLILLQAIATGLAMGLWSRKIDNDELEEDGRGFIATIMRII